MAADECAGFGHYLFAWDQFAAIRLSFRSVQFTLEPALEPEFLFQCGSNNVVRSFARARRASLNAFCQGFRDCEFRHVDIAPANSVSIS